MKPIDTSLVWRLIMPHPLAGITLVGTMGWVYAVAETNEQPAAPQGTPGATPPVLEDGEPLFKLIIRAFGMPSSVGAMVPWWHDTTHTDHHQRAGQ
jgi:hypothetical protein